MTEQPEEMTQLDAIQMHMEVLTITLMRLYDVASAQLAAQNPQLWEELSEKHESGKLHNGFPFMSTEPWDADQE